MVDVFLGWEKEEGIFRIGYSFHYFSNPASSRRATSVGKGEEGAPRASLEG